MKIKFSNFVKGMLVLFIGLCSLVTLGQDPQAPNAVSSISIAPNVSGLSVGDIVHIPITLTTATGPNLPIASASIYIDYSQSVLYPLGPLGYTPIFSGIFTYNPYYSNNRLYISWESSSGNNVSFSNTQIVTLDFIYTGGTTTAMHLRHSPDVGNLCSFITISGNTPISSFTDNTVSGAASGTYTIHSVATGGPYDWNDKNAWQEGKTPSFAANVFITGEEMQIFMMDPFYSVLPKCNNLTINPAGQLTLNTGITLNVLGNMLIESDATGTGSFLNNGTFSVTGSTSVQRWVTSNWTIGLPNNSTIWHYVSSPVSGATIATFMGSLLNKWNEPLERWDTLAIPTTLPLLPGVGYGLAKQAPDGIVTFTGGTLNNLASYSPAITYTAGSAPGWNLIGNPYPCAISWDALTRSNVFGTVYAWKASTHNYAFYNLSSGGTLTDGIIPAEQAFFVQALTNTATIAIPGSSRLHAGTAYYKNSMENLLTMKVQGNDITEDLAIIHFLPEATTGLDPEYDAYKLFGTEDAPQLYSITPSEVLSINALPNIATQPIVPLGLKVGQNEAYTFTASNLETFAPGQAIFLEDLLANKVQDLTSNPVYTFTAAPGDAAHRFNVHFAPVGVSENHSASIKVYSAESTVYVNIPTEMRGNIVVYDLLGREITRTAIQSYSLNKINLNVPSGFYLVKVDGDSNTITGKVFIK